MDLRDVVCIVIKDGDIYRFSHRSFQTYFAAYYTSAVLTDEQQKQLFDSLLSRNRVCMHNIDYYGLLSQIEPERFAENALEEELRNIQRDTDNHSEPDILFLKKYASGVGVFFSEEENNGISYIVPGVNNNYYDFNIIHIFRGYILKIYDNEQENVDNLSQILALMNPICEDSSKYKNEKDKNMAIEFEDFDCSDCVEETTRQEFYELINRNFRTTETRKRLREWLLSLDKKRKSLDRPDFIDNL